MVNFLSIGYGLCEDHVRREAILRKMEVLMQKEKLFIWPSCFFPYEDNLGLQNVNYPYPNYENGDMFLAWAELGTRCYAETNPEIALKYVRNVIDKYESDGLAFQRYSRLDQTGKGDDILSNNIMAVVGLYRNIYGIRPQYNRLYLEPHLPAELNGTQLKYWLRDKNYIISLSEELFSISVNNFSVSGKYPFAVNTTGNELEYFNGKDDSASLVLSGKQPLSVDIIKWDANNMSWNETGKNLKCNMLHEICNLKSGSLYQLFIDGRPKKKYTADMKGIIRFNYPGDRNMVKFQIIKSDSVADRDRPTNDDRHSRGI
jgi:hypothetical protein